MPLAMSARIEVRPAKELSDGEMAEYRRVRAQINYGEVLGYQFASLREWRVLVWIGGQLVSHAGISRRVVTVDRRALLVGAVGGVWTAPEVRGQGLAGLAMRAAAEFVRGTLQCEAGLLICREPVAPFYERVGWQRVPGPLVFDQPSGKVTWHRPILVSLGRLSVWPAGTIDLCGLPW
jgi:GNAT superfamily N-acetyltransferase